MQFGDHVGDGVKARECGSTGIAEGLSCFFKVLNLRRASLLCRSFKKEPSPLFTHEVTINFCSDLYFRVVLPSADRVIPAFDGKVPQPRVCGAQSRLIAVLMYLLHPDRFYDLSGWIEQQGRGAEGVMPFAEDIRADGEEFPHNRFSRVLAQFDDGPDRFDGDAGGHLQTLTALLARQKVLCVKVGRAGRFHPRFWGQNCLMQTPERPGTPPGMDESDVEGRSRLARYLGKEIWPADRDAILQTATAQRAPEEVLSQLRRLPERTFTNLADAWEELGGSNESERT